MRRNQSEKKYQKQQQQKSKPDRSSKENSLKLKRGIIRHGENLEMCF